MYALRVCLLCKLYMHDLYIYIYICQRSASHPSLFFFLPLTPHNQVSAEEYVASFFSLSVEKICVELVQERERAWGGGQERARDKSADRPRIAVGFVTQFIAELARRKQGFRADLRIGKIGVEGADDDQKVVGMRWRERMRGRVGGCGLGLRKRVCVRERESKGR